MSELRIIEASAGSGKTHLLVYEYLKLLFLNPDNFKHILAVTFTNKATEEMKSRIVFELFRLQHLCKSACIQPCNSKSVYLEQLTDELKLSSEQLSHKSKAILHNILHNFSQFSILTIDSFFQQVLRSFLREVGIGTSTRIELDTDQVIQQTVDQLLLQLENNEELYRWLIQYVLEQINLGKSWNITDKLADMAHELLKEKFMSLPSEYQQLLFSENIKTYFRLEKLYSFKNSFEKYLQDKAIQAFSIIEKYQLSEDDFYGKSRGIIGFLKRLKNNNCSNLKIDDRYSDVENWPNKSSNRKAVVKEACTEGGLKNCYDEIMYFINKNKVKYYDTLAILKNIYTYGVLADIGHTLDKVLKENDIQLLGKTMQFLNEIIGNNDTPFIYEKTGRIYKHFIIDEFQDTSYIQWQNFRPLIKESLSNDHLSMVVGDVKQSIYRWRNTDWSILSFHAENDMQDHGCIRTTLDINWRSLPEIVAFNNSFFGDYLTTYNDNLKTVYRSVKQKCAFHGKRKGLVSIHINLEKPDNISEDEGSAYNAVGRWVIEQILKLLSMGYRQKDIAILVRERKEGVEIVEAINMYNKQQKESDKLIHVLSAESALLIQNIAVNIIVETFNYLLNPNDEINLTALTTHYGQVKQLIHGHSAADSLSVQLPNQLIDNMSTLLLLNPLELFEEIIQIFELNQYPPFIPYLQAMHNLLHTFCFEHTPQLKAFVDYWEQKKDKVALEISEEQDAVRILTIHKSKGLQFPNVIIPYCNWSLDYKGFHAPLLWCSAAKTDLEELQFLPIRYSKELEETSFKEAYLFEKNQYFIDNINLLYVAFTRPMHNLFVYVPQLSSSDELKTVGDWLYSFVRIKTKPIGQYINYQQGELGMSDINALSNNRIDYFFEKYPVYPSVGLIKQNASFGGLSSTHSQFGNVMHRLFQFIRYTDDIKYAVDRVIAEGALPLKDRKSCISWLSKLIANPEIEKWFSREWKILTEATVIAPHKHPYRPDRVMIKSSHAVVVDYKFGKKELPSYKNQLKTYMGFLKDMGYNPIEGYLWYVQLDKIERVD
ncbi:MAG: UvrD-helicase domain-containing protein [Bacteroidales bacterium]|nr:UvrD-helicase domain-containing protein [Bacteroidales bacterium]